MRWDNEIISHTKILHPTQLNLLENKVGNDNVISNGVGN